MKASVMISFSKYMINAILNSYGMLFFSKNKIFALLILVVSFFTPFTGACGLAAVIIAILAALALGFSKAQMENGLLTYSVVLFGLGFGTNFEFGTAFTALLIVGALLTFFIATALNVILNKRGLPALSLAFIISTALLIVASKSFGGVGLTHRHIYWYNEMYALGGNRLVNVITTIENWNIPDFIAGFFRSMSAILFQVNIATGIILSIGLLIYSRIAFILMIFGYTVAIFFGVLMGSFNQVDVSYYNMGTNFMLVAVALGGFYLIPSIRSFFWIFISVPIAYLMVIGVGSLLFKVGVPIFSLPFCITVILFLYMLQMRTKPSKLVLTPIQYYSPETNLYRYINGKERLMNNIYHQLSLPFMGEWMVSQGYDGSMTHKGDWGKALDFVILDDEMKTFRFPGNLPEHFYCYNKPVLAPADGIVEDIIDHIDDNEIGGNNAQQNWGNSIVIKHTEGLYTKLSHLKKQSFKVVKGAYVKKGEIVALVGNSGRSPEPHLHFQVQATPNVGSKTLAYPISYFTINNHKEIVLQNNSVPSEGSFVSNVVGNAALQQAFNFQPGYILKVQAPNFADETWEVCTSIYNETYLYCAAQQAFAYFINNGTAFYFTNYFGSKKTLLYHFYNAAYKVLLSSEKQINVKDHFPLNVFSVNPIKWLQDLLAPFYIFIRMRFESEVKQTDGLLNDGSISFTSKQTLALFGISKHQSTAVVQISNGQIQSFSIINHQQTISALCSQ
ncbi:urea transporter [Parasediminibacterium paludis]|uniref:Urea transporter n=2 Tax=Parasediminibacterium paludis TaxID=908966 RepID=A0ABV8PU51_9BACT